MRISLRLQLALLLVISGSIGLAVLAIATWVLNHDFVLDVAASRLQITAQLKAAQVAYNLELMQTAATFLTNRATIQEALSRYNNGTDLTVFNWASAQTNLYSALANPGPLRSGLVLQSQIYAANASGPAGTSSVMNVTGVPDDTIALPWLNSAGGQAYLGDDDGGFPPMLYPNLTVSSDAGNGTVNPVATYNGEPLGLRSTLILGPMMVNSTLSLISFTLPVVKNTALSTILGWATVVVDARLILEVVGDQSGLGQTGQTLLVGPVNTTNNFRPGILGNEEAASVAQVHLLIPLNISAANRHPGHVFGSANLPFPARQYPAVQQAIADNSRRVDDVGSLMSTHNEDNYSVSVGFSMLPTSLVDWIIVVEQSHAEVWQPINYLRTVILACLFGVIGFMMIASLPLAHWAVLPIMRLRAATEQTTAPPGMSESGSQMSSFDSSGKDFAACTSSTEKVGGALSTPGRNESFLSGILRKFRAKKQATYRVQPRDGGQHRVPGKVPHRKVWIKDEMSDLITTFNEMSDELLAQYTQLEDRVRQRTIELECSKKAAEAANECKTLFVANVSHELRTPLNGILGLAAVSLAENDPNQVKDSLRIIEKSGNLLLRSLNDLLTFSSNQLGHQVLTLDERQFAIRDIETQILAIFGQQSRSKQIDLRVAFQETPGDIYGTGKLRDVRLYGDIHRILQVTINLISNSLKFTPKGGSVTLRIRCLAVAPRKRSVIAPVQATFSQHPEPATNPDSGTALFINPREVIHAQGLGQENGHSPPPGKDIAIELSVEDTGPGIEKEMQDRIFEPFVQADAGLSRKHNGTGLGLSISTQLVNLMGGTIRLSSTLGEGSIFTVKVPLRIVFGQSSDTPRASNEVIRPPLRRYSSSDQTLFLTLGSNGRPSSAVPEAHPAAPEQKSELSGSNSSSSHPALSSPTDRSQPVSSSSSHSSTSPSPDLSALHVLVAEDNKVNQEVIRRMLRLEKVHHITIASDGQEALDIITSSLHPTSSPAKTPSITPTFDLILMDIQMPHMDGLEATRLIRQAGFSNPIVALTAFAEKSNVEECYGCGMDYFLAKPVKRGGLRSVLQQFGTKDQRERKEGEGKADEGVEQLEREGQGISGESVG